MSSFTIFFGSTVYYEKLSSFTISSRTTTRTKSYQNFLTNARSRETKMQKRDKEFEQLHFINSNSK